MKFEVFWKNKGYIPRKPLARDIECDYLVVGGGIAGVSLAYFLSSAKNARVALIEKNSIASGATGKGAGMLVLEGELDLQSILEEFGRKKGLIFWKGNHQGLQLIKALVKKERIDCDYHEASTIYACSEKYERRPHVLNEYIAEKDIERTPRLLVGSELRRQVGTQAFHYAIFSRNHGLSVNPLKLTQNLSKAAERRGVAVYERTPLLRVAGHTAFTPKGMVRFKKIIFATDKFTRHSKIKTVETTVAVTEPLSKRDLQKFSLSKDKVAWDSRKIYYYFKVTPDNRLLLGYGDHPVHRHHIPKGPHAPHLARIKKFLSFVFPGLHKRIAYVWSGTFGETEQKVPLIEEKGDRIIVAAAASQVMCVAAAKYVADRLLGRRSKLELFFRKK